MKEKPLFTLTLTKHSSRDEDIAKYIEDSKVGFKPYWSYRGGFIFFDDVLRKNVEVPKSVRKLIVKAYQNPDENRFEVIIQKVRDWAYDPPEEDYLAIQINDIETCTGSFRSVTFKSRRKRLGKAEVGSTCYLELEYE